MSSRKNTIVALVATAVAAGAIGLPWALAETGPSLKGTVWVKKNCVRFDVDDQPACGLRKVGPRGLRGLLGPSGIQGARGRDGSNGTNGIDGTNGADGARGPQGVQGVQGATGAVGLTGAKGDTGAQGAQGIQGAPGHTVVVSGTLITQSSTVGAGTVLTPTVARCPLSIPSDPSSQRLEVYGGGVQITKSGSQSSSDVVTVEQHYAGTWISNTQVTVLPADTTPGTISTTSADGYLGQAVVTQLNSGDTVKVQAYAVCGP